MAAPMRAPGMTPMMRATATRQSMWPSRAWAIVPGIAKAPTHTSEVATAFGREDGNEREAAPNKLRSVEIAHTIKSVLEMDDRGMIPELSVWASNPW